MIVGYRLSSLDNSTDIAPAQSTPEIDKKITEILEDYGERLKKLESQFVEKPTKGGVKEWQL